MIGVEGVNEFGGVIEVDSYGAIVENISESIFGTIVDPLLNANVIVWLRNLLVTGDGFHVEKGLFVVLKAFELGAGGRTGQSRKRQESRDPLAIQCQKVGSLYFLESGSSGRVGLQNGLHQCLQLR